MKKIGVILAAGKSIRFDSDIPKQFYMIYQRPILFYSIKSFLQCKEIEEIYVVGDVDIKNKYLELFNKYFPNNKLIFVKGGHSRQDSLYNAVIEINTKYNNSIIVSHCASRPYLPISIINHNIITLRKGFCVDTFKVNYDTVWYREGFIDRNKVLIGLTPQTFYSEDYIKAKKSIDNVLENYTCACSLLQKNGIQISPIFTNEPILKITTKEDIPIFEGLLKNVGK